MDSSSLTINFSLDTGDGDTVLDESFINLEQVLPEPDVATVADVANLLESLYDINPCTDSVNSGTTASTITEDNVTGDEPTSPKTIEEFNALIQSEFSLSSCSTDSIGNWITQIKVIPSVAGDDNYTLRLSNGDILSTVMVDETIEEDITVSESSGFQLFYPVLGDSKDKFLWNGSVIDANGGSTPPEIVRTGNTLSWDRSVTGSVYVNYKTRYFLVELVVKGTVEGVLGECSAIAFYDGKVETLNLEQPDTKEDEASDDSDFCPTTVAEEIAGFGGTTDIESPTDEEEAEKIFYIYRDDYLCQCSGDLEYSEYTRGPTPEERDAVDRVTEVPRYEYYIDCNEVSVLTGVPTSSDSHGSTIGSSEYYIEQCCYPPLFPLPKCKVMYRRNPGGVGLSQDTIDYYTAYANGNVSFIPVSPEGECDPIVTEQKIHPLSCCDEVVDMEWDEDNSVDFIPDNSSGVISLINGSGVYEWSTNSVGTFFNVARTKKKITTLGHSVPDGEGGYVIHASVTVYTDEDACGMLGITVNDGCTKLNREIQAEEGSWVKISSWNKYGTGNWESTCKIQTTIDYTNVTGFGTNSYTATAIEGRYKLVERAGQDYYYVDRILGKCQGDGTVCCGTTKINVGGSCDADDETWCAARGVPASILCLDWSPSAYHFRDPDDMDPVWYFNFYTAPHMEWGQVGIRSVLGHICGSGPEGCAYTQCAIGHWKQLVASYLDLYEWQC